MIIISISLLSGCMDASSANPNSSKNESGNESDKPKKASNSFEKIKAPFTISEGEFGAIEGWLDDQTIVYLTNSDKVSILWTFNLYTGKNVKIYESDSPIVSVNISPSRERLLIHSSSTSEEGIITVIDKKGESLVTKSIISSEITFVWNPFNDDLVLVSSFNDQWDFQVSVLNIKTNELKHSTLTKQPFASWVTKDELIYLNWDNDDPAFFAPVIKQGISDATGEELEFSNIFQLYSFKDVVLMISVDKDDKEKAVYTFLSNRFKKLTSFTIPQLTEFSDWLVPFCDFSQSKNQFLTFRPLSSGEVDTYKDGFQLVQYHLDSKEENVLLEGMENKPISLSPNGNLCLYGFQLENIIDLQSKKIVPLVKD